MVHTGTVPQREASVTGWPPEREVSEEMVDIAELVEYLLAEYL